MPQSGARGQNLGHLRLLFFVLLLFFLYGIIQFEQHVLLRVSLSVTSDHKVQCPRVGLEIKIYDTPAGVYMLLRALFLVGIESTRYTLVHLLESSH